MNKKAKTGVKVVLFVLIFIAFIYIGTRDFSHDLEVDSEKFDADYSNVSKDNVFVYVNASEVYSILKNGSGIIFFGYPSNEWSGYYANMLNEAAKRVGVEEILYYDFYDDRNDRNGVYQSIVLKLSNYLSVLDDNTQEIYAPMVVVVKNGEVLTFDNETAIRTGTINPELYWDEFKSGIKLNTFETMFQDYLKNE